MAQLLFPIVLFAGMYFLLIRPQQQRARRQRELIQELEPGDRVVTAGGLIGTIRVLTDQEIHLEVAPGVEVKVLRVAVSRHLEDSPTPEEEYLEADDEEDDRP